MTVPLRTGAFLRPPPLARTLIAEPDGIRLWPGTRLTEKRGAAIVPIAKDAAYQAVARLHGFPAVYAPLWPALQRASALISAGEVAAAQSVLDRLGPLPLSPDGAALMRAIAARQGIASPALGLAKGVRLLSARDIARLAPLYDGLAAEARRLQPAFVPGAAPLAKSVWNPALHPRLPAGGTGAGEFAASGAAGLGEAAAEGVGEVGEVAGGVAALGVAAGLVATTQPTGRTDEALVPNRPDLAGRLDQDTGRLTLYRSGDAAKTPLLEAATTLDGTLRDSANRLVATPRGDGSLGFNDAVLTSIPPEPHEVPPVPGFPAMPPHVPTRVSQPANPMLPAPPPAQDQVQLPTAQINLPPDDLPDTSIVERSNYWLVKNMKQAAALAGQALDLTGMEAHHIVAVAAKRAAKVQALFKRLGIDLNDARNGIALPRDDHAGLHTHEYYDRINDLFKDLVDDTEATQQDVFDQLEKAPAVIDELIEKRRNEPRKGKK